MTHTAHTRAAGAALVASLLLGACVTDTTSTTPEPMTVDTCSTQVIVTLSESTAPEPEAGLVADLASTAQVRLTYLRSAGPGIHVFSLHADDLQPSCESALDRLRRDPRIRSIELDEHRVRHG